MMFKYTVRYMMTGKDHDGYCSGMEDDDMENLDEIVVVTRRLGPIERLSQLNFHEDGCTSMSGSGYCRGAYRFYHALRVLKITREDDDESDDESEDDSDSESDSEDDSVDEIAQMMSRLNRLNDDQD